MAVFHLNPLKGTVSRCHAQPGNCPFGGESGQENHFPSVREASSAYERMRNEDLLPPPQRAEALEVQEARAKAGAALDQWLQVREELKKKGNNIPRFRFTPDWYELVQRRKNLYYEKLYWEQEVGDLTEEGYRERRKREKEAEAAEADASFKRWQEEQEEIRGAYSPHPPIGEENRLHAQGVISTFSGLSPEEVARRVKAKEVEGKDETTATREVFQEAGLRRDMKVVSLDLETAAPRMKGRMDKGPYTTILEVGMAVRHPSGRREEESFLSGVPPTLAAVEGTGAEKVHGISLAQVEGKTPFTDDPALQKHVLDKLKGSLLVAHNASFEVNQLKHNLPGFAQALDRGEITVLDTKNVSRFFLPEAKNNSNESFVEATGGSYEGAHRALADARMTLGALLRLVGMDDKPQEDQGGGKQEPLPF